MTIRSKEAEKINRLSLSRMFTEPDFRGVDELEGILPRLETCHFEPVYVLGKPLENRLAVVSDKTGQTYSLPTERYHISQNREVIIPFAKALVDSGIEDFYGSIREVGGKMFASIAINHPSYKPTVKGEAFGMVMTLRNSFDCEMAMSGELDIVRLACSNGMIRLFAESFWYAIHTVSMEEAVSEWGQFLDRVLDAPAMLAPMVENAKSTEIRTSEAEKYLLGAGFGSIHSGWILDQIDGSRQVMTAWDLYNAGTATFSHLDDGQLKLESNRENLAKCNRLLVVEAFEKYLADGSKKLEAIQEAKKERQARRNLA